MHCDVFWTRYNALDIRNALENGSGDAAIDNLIAAWVKLQDRKDHGLESGRNEVDMTREFPDVE